MYLYLAKGGTVGEAYLDAEPTQLSPHNQTEHSKGTKPGYSTPPRLRKFKLPRPTQRDPSLDLGTISEQSISDESEIVTSIDISALKQLPKKYQIKMAEMKEEQAQKFLDKDGGSPKNTEEMGKILQVCDNVKRLHRGDPPYTPDCHKATKSTPEDNKTDTVLGSDAHANDEAQASLERPEITDKELPIIPDIPDTPKSKRALRNKKSFARIRAAVNRDDVQTRDAEPKSNTSSKHDPIKQSVEVHDGNTKQKSKANDERVLTKQGNEMHNGDGKQKSKSNNQRVPTNQESVTSPRKSKPLANIRKAFQPDEKRDLHKTISQYWHSKIDTLSVARQVKKGPRAMQTKAHTKTSGESSPTHKASDAGTIGSSNDFASTKSYQDDTPSGDAAVTGAPSVRSEDITSDSGLSPDAQRVLARIMADNPSGERVAVALRGRARLIDIGPSRDSNQNEQLPSASAPLATERPCTPVKQRDPSPTSSVHSSNYSGDEASVRTATAVRIFPESSCETSRARLEGYNS